MAQLDELSQAISALTKLAAHLEGDERDKIITIRNELDDKASELAHKTLIEGTPELNNAIAELNKATQAAKEAKVVINDTVEIIVKVADTIAKTAKAIASVAALIAKL